MTLHWSIVSQISSRKWLRDIGLWHPLFCIAVLDTCTCKTRVQTGRGVMRCKDFQILKNNRLKNLTSKQGSCSLFELKQINLNKSRPFINWLLRDRERPKKHKQAVFLHNACSRHVLDNNKKKETRKTRTLHDSSDFCPASDQALHILLKNLIKQIDKTENSASFHDLSTPTLLSLQCCCQFLTLYFILYWVWDRCENLTTRTRVWFPYKWGQAFSRDLQICTMSPDSTKVKICNHGQWCHI